MKILFLISSMNCGGAERVASTLANAWAARGDQVTLMPTFSGRGECFYELSTNVNLVFLADLVSNRSRSWANGFDRLYTLRRFMRIEQPNVIISFLPNVNVAAVIATFGLSIPVVICERTDPFVFPIPFLWRVVCRFIYPFATALVVQTQSVAAKYLASRYLLKKIRVIYNPIVDEFLAIQPFIRDTKIKRLISVGRLDNGKQFHVLINVFANLEKRNTNWSLRIIGDGVLKPILQQQITELGLENCVTLSERSAVVSAELAKADIFVLTSKYEGFPNALLEAMAVGLPCVSFDCPSGPREMSMDGQIALLVPLNDEKALESAIEKLMLDADLRQMLGNKARASAIERFCLNSILKQWDLLFRELGVKT